MHRLVHERVRLKDRTVLPCVALASTLARPSQRSFQFDLCIFLCSYSSQQSSGGWKIGLVCIWTFRPLCVCTGCASVCVEQNVNNGEFKKGVERLVT